MVRDDIWDAKASAYSFCLFNGEEVLYSTKGKKQWPWTGWSSGTKRGLLRYTVAGVQGSLRISAIPNAFSLDKKAE